jgi:hypothetical protein
MDEKSGDTPIVPSHLETLNILDQAENVWTKKKTDGVFLLISDTHKQHNNCHNQQVFSTTMFKKPPHNHYFNQTNQKPQPKPETNPKKTTEKKAFAHRAPTTTKRKPKSIRKATTKQPSNCEKKKNCGHQQFFFYNKINTSTNPFNPKCSAWIKNLSGKKIDEKLSIFAMFRIDLEDCFAVAEGGLGFFILEFPSKKHTSGYQAIFVWVGFYLLMQKWICMCLDSSAQ